MRARRVRSSSPVCIPTFRSRCDRRVVPSSRINLADARVLGPDFFARSALTVARELMGKFLMRRIHGEKCAAIIHETEAYIGPHDLACHASRGRTARTE